MAEGKWTLKACYKEEVRRLKDWPEDATASFEALRKAALGLFELEDQGQRLQYSSDSGEQPLTPETLKDALESATGGLLRVSIEACESPVHVQVEAQELPAVQNQEVEPQPQPNEALKAGWNRFKDQVVSDFKSNFQDMNGAVAGDSDARARQVAGKVAGVTAGLCASARLIPLHGTKLAAQGIATCAKLPTAQGPVEEPAAQAVQAPKDEVDRFKQQVFQDFETGRSEIQSAFGYFFKKEPVPEGQPRLAKDVLPAVASTVAGLTVASTLVPLRATRLAVASLVQRSPAEAPEGQATEAQAEAPAEQGLERPLNLSHA